MAPSLPTEAGSPATAVAIAEADRLLSISRWSEVVDLLRPVLLDGQRAQDWPIVARASLRIGRAESRRLNHAAAAQALRLSLDAATRLSDPFLACDAFRHLGLVHERNGDLAIAAEFLDEALTLATDSGMEDRRGGILLDLGNVAYQGQDISAAEERYQQALDEKLGSEDRYRALHNMSMVLLETGRASEARPIAETLIRESEASGGYPHLQAAGLSLLGRIRAALGDVPTGLRLLDEALAKHEILGNGLSKTTSHFYRGEILEKAGRRLEAEAEYAECLNLSQKVHSLVDIGKAAFALARLTYSRGDANSAVAWAERAVASFREGENPTLAQDAARFLASIREIQR